MRWFAEEDAGGVGERSRNALIEHAQLAEEPDLTCVERMVGDLCAGEVAHQQRDAVILALHTRRQRGGFVQRHAEPIHAGVHMDRRAATPVLGGDEGVPFGELGGAVDYRLGVEFGERHSRSGRESIEHVDRGIARARAHAPRFGDVGHEESLAAGLGELGGDRLKAQSIGIGFDHGGAFDGEEPLRQRPPVRLDGIEIDRQRTAGFGVRRAFRPFRATVLQMPSPRYDGGRGGGKAG